MTLTIEIFDADGNMVEQSTVDAPTATQEQIDEMVAMIDAGTPAHLAATLAMQPQE
jgi:hypothetical protein